MMVKEALIDCSSGKFAKLLLDGEEVNGAIRIDKIKNGGKRVMKERVKIITDGEKAEVYIDGKKVRCTDMELHFIGHVNENPMITVDAQWHKTDENGNVILNEDKTEVLTEGIKINC